LHRTKTYLRGASPVAWFRETRVAAASQAAAPVYSRLRRLPRMYMDMSLLSSPTLNDQAEPVVAASRGTRSRTIGVLSLSPSPYAKATLLAGIQQATCGSDYCVSIVSPRTPNRESLLAAVETLRWLAVDGLLVLAPPCDAIETLAAVAGEIPLVALESPPQNVLSTVTSDHYAGAAAATGHLLELDHRSVFHVAGPADGPAARSCLAGWRDTLRVAGADIPDAMIGSGTAEGGYELGRRLASRGDATAIFVAGDQMALGVLRALFEAGRRVPEEVSVIGFGGTPEGEFFRPPLTTVGQNFAEIGRRGADLLRAGIETGPLTRVHETIPADLILRASTAAAG
jgi:DNA-binding LacI/PurR family transcriptional regulator